MVTSQEIPRDDAEAALSARRDLGSDYEPAIVDSFVERLDAIIEQRVAEAVRRQSSESSDHEAKLSARAELEKTRSAQRLALIIVSMGVGVPLTGLVAEAGMQAIVLVWTALVLLNLIFTLGGRPRD